MKTSKELKTLKEKMRAVQSGDYDVEAENPQIIKCWERLNCNKTDCPAYGKLRCWSIAGTACHGDVQGQFAQKIGDCRECVVYQESCGDDIGELIEIFNQMTKDIKYDFLERIRTDEETAKEERLAELRNMVAGVAHETRNPLHSIGMAASFLKKNYQDEPATEFLTIIEDEVKKISDLIAIFLSFSEAVPLDLKPCDLNDIVIVVIEQYKGLAGQQDILVQFQADEDLSEIVSDAARIRDCLAHLLENGLEASDDGAVITLSIEKSKDVARISVQDKGPGISAAEQEKIFKPFYTTKIHGPGLGLAIVERTVKELKGGIQVSSKPGKGATFTILLPLDVNSSVRPS
jgi:two-component system sensor histidine kinase HydH